MRKSTLKKAAITLFIALCGLYLPVYSQSTIEELILQSPGVYPERNLEGIISELRALNGIEYAGFCTNQNVILLRVDRRKHADDKYILEVFTQKLLEIHIKTGASIAQVIAVCPNMILPNGQPAPDPGGSGNEE